MVDGLYDEFKDNVNKEIEKARDWVHEHSNKIDKLRANKSVYYEYRIFFYWRGEEGWGRMVFNYQIILKLRSD